MSRGMNKIKIKEKWGGGAHVRQSCDNVGVESGTGAVNHFFSLELHDCVRGVYVRIVQILSKVV